MDSQSFIPPNLIGLLVNIDLNQLLTLTNRDSSVYSELFYYLFSPGDVVSVVPLHYPLLKLRLSQNTFRPHCMEVFRKLAKTSQETDYQM